MGNHLKLSTITTSVKQTLLIKLKQSKEKNIIIN